MKTKKIFLLLMVFALGGCVKDDISINDSTIDISITGNKESNNQDNDNASYWFPVTIHVHYKEIAQSEIDEIRNQYFNIYNPKHPFLRLMSYTTKIPGNYEIWYGKYYNDGGNVTYPLHNNVIDDLEDEEGVDYATANP